MENHTLGAMGNHTSGALHYVLLTKQPRKVPHEGEHQTILCPTSILSDNFPECSWFHYLKADHPASALCCLPWPIAHAFHAFGCSSAARRSSPQERGPARKEGGYVVLRNLSIPTFLQAHALVGSCVSQLRSNHMHGLHGRWALETAEGTCRVICF